MSVPISFNTSASSFTPTSPSSSYYSNPQTNYFGYLKSHSEQPTDYNLLRHNYRFPTADLYSVDHVVFDPYEELLWTTDNSGRIVSYVMPSLEKYSSWKAFSNYGVKDLLVHDQGVLSIGFSGIRMSNRGGVLKFNYENPSIKNLKCMGWWGDQLTQRIFIGSDTSYIVFNYARRKVEKEISVDSPISCVDRNGGTVFGSKSGEIFRVDQRVFGVEKIFGRLGNGEVLDLSTSGHTLATVSGNQNIKLYDLRRIDYRNPIKLEIEASLLKCHPKMNSSMVAVSQNGMFQTVSLDQWNGYNYPLKVDLARGAKITSFDLSSNGEMMCFSDSMGSFHLWGYNGSTVNDYSRNTIMPRKTPEERKPFLAYLENSDNSPLLSNWTGNHYFSRPIPFTGISNNILSRRQMKNNIGYIMCKPGESVGHIYNRPLVDQTDDYTKERNQKIFRKKKVATNIKRLPKNYRRVHVKKKLRLDSFYDPAVQSKFNKTEYSGLENTLPNSYLNPLIQLLYHIPQLSMNTENHLCENEHCFCCEIGLLSSNIRAAGGVITDARNFLRCLYYIPSANSYDVFEENSQLEHKLMIQQALDLILKQLETEFNESIPVSYNPDVSPQVLEYNPITELFSSEYKRKIECAYCYQTNETSTQKFYYNLTGKFEQATFTRVLEETFSNTTSLKRNCPSCDIYQNFSSQNITESLPNILILNCSQIKTKFWRNVGNDDSHFSMKKDSIQSWLPAEFSIRKNGTRMAVDRYQPKEGSQRYRLKGVISNINDGRHSENFLISQVNVSQSDTQEWILFNDFAVSSVPIEEVLHISHDWKTPVILFYEKAELESIIPTPEKIDLLGNDIFFVKRLNQKIEENMNFRKLDREESLEEKLVSIDSEFVSLASEEIIGARGKNVIVRPRMYSAARLSVLRTWGDETAFIDDYIRTNENIIEDFLTRYSGLYPGDLDLEKSKHHLTTMKTVNLKLRRLIDLKCIFVGHGLTTDFKILNVIVPPDQIIDTVKLFYKKESNRQLKLSFLSGLLLQNSIQEVIHDSIEDSEAVFYLYYF
eukprot:TRINITY_DN2764_c0_g1_i1.p1 TRINITY_DN2764_c0_g1~~TRINITY_DN2764_c0_g1_i1.p1  ORF type:complete len:1047 (-),score=207.14 TRINITY_DN2764_c0_g1_i1:284-3424(-)